MTGYFHLKLPFSSLDFFPIPKKEKNERGDNDLIFPSTNYNFPSFAVHTYSGRQVNTHAS